MALSLKNTLASLALSGVMLFAGFLSGQAPITASQGNDLSGNPAAQASESIDDSRVAGKRRAKRALTTPYFSFGKANFPGAR